MARLKRLYSSWRSFAASRRGRRVFRVAQGVFTACVVAYLIYKLADVGWREVWAARPRHLLFYLFNLIVWGSIPITDMVVYRLLWRLDTWRNASTFIKKRIFNQDVLGYSGEVYFIAWARRHAGRSDREVVEDVRDINIVSSLASTFVAVALLVVYLSLGTIRPGDLIGGLPGGYLVGGAVLVAVLGAVGYRFRRYLFTMRLRAAAGIFGLQCARLVVGQVLRIGQWMLVMPDIPIQVWFSLAALSVVISRIPVVPSQDLVFMGAGVEMSTILGISQAGVFSMLAVSSGLDKLLNATLFVVLTLADRRRARIRRGDRADHPTGPVSDPVSNPASAEAPESLQVSRSVASEREPAPDVSDTNT